MIGTMARILIVDDSSYMATAVKRFMEGEGHEVVATGEDGFEGVALYKEHHPDLVIMDITMPNKDGRDCLAEIMEFDQSARVLVVSGSVKELSIIMECLNIGAKGYVEKPLKFADEQFCKDFRSTVQKALKD